MVCSAPTDVPPLCWFGLAGRSGWSQPQNLTNSGGSSIEELVAGGEREPEVPFARLAKRDSGGHSDVGVLEEKVSGLGRRHAGSANVGECVERPLNQRARDAVDRTQSFGQ